MSFRPEKWCGFRPANILRGFSNDSLLVNAGYGVERFNYYNKELFGLGLRSSRRKYTLDEVLSLRLLNGEPIRISRTYLGTRDVGSWEYTYLLNK